ncbi:hypothetical protein EJD97_020228, partial [Solanum chilense]
KGDNNSPKQRMARPFELPPPTPMKAKSSIRPVLSFQNKYTALAEYPKLPTSSQQKLLKPNCPPQPQKINLRPPTIVSPEASSSSLQTKSAYAMKTPESFAQAVNPELTNTIPSKPIPKEESF